MVKYFTIAFILAATSLMAADNYLIGTGWGGPSMNYTWSTGLSPTESDDVFLDYKYYYESQSPTPQSWRVDLWVPEGHVNSIVNSLTIQNLYNPDTLAPVKLQLIVASGTTAGIRTVNDFNVIGDTYKSEIRFGVSKGSSDSAVQARFIVGGDMNIGKSDYKTGEGVSFLLGETAANMGPLEVKVSGNLNIYGNSTLGLNVGKQTGKSGTTEQIDFVVSGVLNMVGSGGNDNPTLFLNTCSSGTTPGETTIDVGGISGTGLIRNDTGSLGGSSLLIIRTAEGATTTYSGILKDDITTGGNSKVSILMAGYGTQVLDGSVDISGFSEIKRGTLLSTGHFGSLYINKEGTFGATSKSSPIGTVSIGNMTFSDGGTVLIDIDGANCDLIQASTLSLGTATYLTIDFGLTNIIEGTEYKIFECGKISDNFTVDNFKVKDIDGYDPHIRIDDNNVYISFTAVPEPALFASIIGVLALAFAARRKSK